MCANNAKKSTSYLVIAYPLMVILGVFTGLSDIGLLQSFGLAISDIFINKYKAANV